MQMKSALLGKIGNESPESGAVEHRWNSFKRICPNALKSGQLPQQPKCAAAHANFATQCVILAPKQAVHVVYNNQGKRPSSSFLEADGVRRFR